MKLDKNQQKQLIKAIYISSDRRGYKTKTNTIYSVKDDTFIHCDFLVVNSQKLVYRSILKIITMMTFFGRLCKCQLIAKRVIH